MERTLKQSEACQPPCMELIEAEQEIARRGQQIDNSVEWQGRIEARLNWIFYSAIGALLSALMSAVGMIVTLLVLLITRKP